MTRDEFKQMEAKGQVQSVPLEALGIGTGSDTPEQPQTLEEFIAELWQLRLPVKYLTTAPTWTPRNFLECFAFYDSGGVRRLYLYVNKVWRYVALT